MTTRMTRPFWRLALTAVIAAAVPAGAQEALTAPKAFFGHDIGADYVLPDYTQFVKYWETLSRQSDRMTLDTIGTTAEGRPQVMAIITAPANRGKIDRYREIAERLARAEGLTDEQARALAAEGKGIVWIDGGLHATEVLGAQQLLETVWQLVSRNDAEIRRFLDDLVILAVHANPDGMELVSDWYMRPSDPKQRTTNTIPRLYQKYIGHDNNRDFYASTQPESENMNRVLYREWYPQIMYNHHQTGPAGTVMFAPPFRDPANYNYHPLIRTQLDLVGASMHNRFVVENKPGVTMRSGANYSTWWNGGLRTTVYFHNMIGLLTETIGNPTPMEIPFLPNRQLASADLPYPIKPQPWHFRQSIDYSVTANWAVLDVASRHREQFLYNIYKMGSDQIAAGSTDSWTIWPKRIAAVQEAIAAERTGESNGNGAGAARRGGAASAKFYEMLREPARRDPRGYVIPASQADFGTATKFVWALQETGIDVHRATSAFTVGGKQYPAGSYVVKTAQAFRAHVLDMFEPQDHPNDVPYEGGPPKPPYDNAGWTLAMQMGVQFDRILDGFDGPFEKLQAMATVPAGTVAQAPNGGGWLLDHRPNDAMLAVNRLLASKVDVYWLKAPLAANGRTYAPGTLYVPASAAARPVVAKLAQEQGLDFDAAAVKAPAGAHKLQAKRVGLWDRYGGSMPSGWTRWIMEQFEQPYSVVYAQELDAGNLRDKYDVLVFVDGAIPERDGAARPFDVMPGSSSVPAEFRSWLGRVSVAKTVPQLKRFMEQGGTVITIGSSTILGEHVGLPIANHLSERSPTAGDKPLGEEKFYVPGSLLEVAVDSTHPAAAGMGGRAIVMYDNSPVFRLGPDAALKGVRPIAWFDTAEPLRSGWAWGQDYLQGGVAAAAADVGRGKLYLYGPEILFRAQPHGTFKLFFNGIHAGAE
ncbi:MAG TPA: M14 metallopeptidase family protein [Gemmatimonadaceae bacterium]|nr:M14 metallopeptidase family protein [Gemmatimonadaceae bacterium]